MNLTSEGYSYLLQGHDTTSSALFWAVQLLGEHTDVQVMLPFTVPKLIMPRRKLKRPHSNLRVSDLLTDIQLCK
jgi:cytochrome P450